MLTEDEKLVGEKIRAFLLGLLAKRIRSEQESPDRDPRFLPILRIEQESIAAYPLENKRHLNGLRLTLQDDLVRLKGFMDAEAFASVRRQLVAEGLLVADDFPENILKRGIIKSKKEMRMMEEYSEELFQQNDLVNLEKVNQLLAAFVQSK